MVNHLEERLFKMKMSRGKTILVLVFAVLLVSASACQPSEPEQIEGIIQNVDAANGEITIVTEDGETITFNIDPEVSVDAQGSPTTFDKLEIGASIQVEVNEDNQVVQGIKTLQTEVDVKEEVGDIEEDAGDTEEDAGGAEEGSGNTGEDSGNTEEDSGNTEEDSGDTEEDSGNDSRTQDDPDDGDIEPAVELKPDVEPSVDGEVVPGGNVDIEGDAVPGGDVDIDGDGRITIVDVVGGLEALRAKVAEGIAENRISGYYDAEWIRNAEAEMERLAKEIERALSDDTYIVVIDGRALIMDIDPIGDLPDPVIDDPPDDGHPDDGDGHPDDGDGHPDDGDDHPDDGDGHSDDGGDDHSDDGGGDHSDDGDGH